MPSLSVFDLRSACIVENGFETELSRELEPGAAEDHD